MSDVVYKQPLVTEGRVKSLRLLLDQINPPFNVGQSIGIKVHWGEIDNHSFLEPDMAREIVRWLKEMGTNPFIFDTTVLYSGSRRTGAGSLATAVSHGYSEDFLGCPVVIADGMDGRDVVGIPVGYKHFKTAQVASLINKTDGFVIFSHFKGSVAASYGGALKNMGVGFSSRAHKQRMHADVFPILNPNLCTKCGTCVSVCATGAATIGPEGFPVFSRRLCQGCAQCIGLCPVVALVILWGNTAAPFLEKLVETGAAIWKIIGQRTIVINALLNIVSQCDCLLGTHPVIAPDYGYVMGDDPLVVDLESVNIIGPSIFEKTHPIVAWREVYAYAKKIGFYEGSI